MWPRDEPRKRKKWAQRCFERSKHWFCKEFPRKSRLRPDRIQDERAVGITWAAYGSDLFVPCAQSSLVFWKTTPSNLMIAHFELCSLKQKTSWIAVCLPSTTCQIQMHLSHSHQITCLLLAKEVLPPPGNFSRPDLYSKRRWRRIQYLSDQFWRRCQQGYCLLQQIR